MSERDIVKQVLLSAGFKESGGVFSVATPPLSIHVSFTQTLKTAVDYFGNMTFSQYFPKESKVLAGEISVLLLDAMNKVIPIRETK